MRKLSPARLADNTSIDLTPMLDVFLMLGIILALSTSIYSEATESAADDFTVENTKAPGKLKILVELNGNEIFIDGHPEPVEPRFLRSRYENLLRINPQAELVLIADTDANPIYVDFVKSLSEDPWMCNLQISTEFL